MFAGSLTRHVHQWSMSQRRRISPSSIRDPPISLRFFQSFFAIHGICTKSSCFCGHFGTFLDIVDGENRCALELLGLRIRSRWCGTLDRRLRSRSTRTVHISVGCRLHFHLEILHFSMTSTFCSPVTASYHVIRCSVLLL